jgi:hypothetical protein
MTKCLDVPDGKDADGTKLHIWTCVDGNTNQMWEFASDNTIRWVGHNKYVSAIYLVLFSVTSIEILNAYFYYKMS